MHIPDGLLEPAVIISTGAISAITIAAAIKKSRAELEDTMVPRTGILAAFLFVAQMLQFPVAPGISGHLLGGALTAILAGPWIASLVITTVLIIQCFLFQDGGVMALGANIFNMAIIGVFTAYFSYNIIKKVIPGAKAEAIAVIFAAFISVVLAAAAAGIELGLSGVFPIHAGIMTIVGIHIFIGLGEAVITMAAIVLITKSLPEYFPVKVKQSQ